MDTEATQRQKRLDRTMDEMIRRELEYFKKEFIERRRRDAECVSLTQNTRDTTPEKRR
ncbi:MAG: hypothetical protein ACRCUY_09010 [Thermoguttaceae bacterium]